MIVAMRALWDSIVRTIVPFVVGVVIAWVATTGLTLDPQFEAALSAALTGLLGSAYYIVARILEVKVSPKFGWLLGLAKAPEYPAGTASDKEG